MNNKSYANVRLPLRQLWAKIRGNCFVILQFWFWNCMPVS